MDLVIKDARIWTAPVGTEPPKLNDFVHWPWTMRVKHLPEFRCEAYHKPHKDFEAFAELRLRILNGCDPQLPSAYLVRGTAYGKNVQFFLHKVFGGEAQTDPESSEFGKIVTEADQTEKMWRCTQCQKWSHAVKQPKSHVRWTTNVRSIPEDDIIEFDQGDYDHLNGQTREGGYWVKCGPFEAWEAKRLTSKTP